MKLTIITPSYNQGRFITDCIESVAVQATDDTSIQVEHIVMDACSTDETVSILNQYPHLKWISEPDRGQSDAINKGVAMALSDWVIWLNADDYLLPGALRTIKELILQKPECNLFYGHTIFVGEGGETIRRVYQILHRPALARFGLYSPPTSGTVFQTSLLRDHPLDISYHYVMDTEWFLRNGSLIQPCLVQDFTVAFRVWSGSKTGPSTLGGETCPQHQDERVRYRERYILTSLPRWLRSWQATILTTGRFCLLPEYYAKKVYALFVRRFVFSKKKR